MTPMFSIFTLANKFDCAFLTIFQSFHLFVSFIKISFNDCQPKTIGFRVSTSNLGREDGLSYWSKHENL